MSLLRYFGPSISWKHKDTRSKITSYTRITRAPFCCKRMGGKSAGKRSRALNVRYFFLTDQVEKGNLRITYCPTDDMTADYMTKPLQGEKFRKFRAEIMGL